MKCLILWADETSTNLGVRALASGTRALIQRVEPAAEFSFQGYGPGDAPVRIGSLRPQLRRLAKRRDELIDWVRTFDFVVDTRAGDSFADIYGLGRLSVMSAMTEIVRRAKVPLVMGPQTIGPFQTRRGRLMAGRTLHASRLVMARDSVSAQQAADLGRPVDVLTTDVVFALPQTSPAGERDVVINPSGLLWQQNSHVDADAYRQIITDLIRRLLDQGRRVALLAHVVRSPLADNDVPVVEELARRFEGQVEPLVPTDLEDVRSYLASASVVVGSRMHACLNALSLGRPAIPLAYSRKFSPLLEALRWSETIDLRTGDEHVERVIAALDEPDLQQRADAVRARATELLVSAEAAIATIGTRSDE